MRLVVIASITTPLAAPALPAAPMLPGSARITRVTLPQARSNEGTGGKTRQVVQAFRTTVENLRDVPVTVALEERIPVAQDERVTVKLGERTTDGSSEIAERPGVLNWKLELAPKEKRDVTLEYTVRHPKDMILPGL
jgi:hypothetical protein